MKPILLLLCSILIFTAGAQKLNFTSRANMNTATGEQVGKFKNAYGLGAGLEMAVKRRSPFKLFLNADFGINGMKSMPYDFEYRNILTHTTINYTSCVFQLSTGMRSFFNEGKKLNPYVGVGIGMLGYTTDYYIEDPENPDGCRALETSKIQSDKAFIGRVEGGLRYKTNWEVDMNKRISLDFGISYLRGTEAKYMRLTNQHEMEEGTDYNVKFETPDNQVHEHAIGKTYNTVVNQLAFHIGIVIPLSSVEKPKQQVSSCGMQRSCCRHEF